MGVTDVTNVSDTQDLETELKELIVSALKLQDVTAKDIDSHAPLFGTGLGLDSIDALELAIALDERYGLRIQPDHPEHRKAFDSVHSLAAFIAQAGENQRAE